jgi:hypothetical protein
MASGGGVGRAVRPVPGRATGGFRRPTIYGSAYEQGHSKRSVQTVIPLAARLGLDVVLRHAAGDEAHLARELSARPGGHRGVLALRGHPQDRRAPGRGVSAPCPCTGRVTGLTSCGPSPATETDGDSRRYRRCCCPVTCPTRSPTDPYYDLRGNRRARRERPDGDFARSCREVIRAGAPRSYWSGLQQDPAAHRSVFEAAVGLGGLG